MKNRVLILSVSRKVSLVKAFKDAGWVVIGQDKDPNAVALKFCDEIDDFQSEIKADLIIPTRDAELKQGSYRCSDETIDICIDKFKFYKWCKANGFQTPEVYFVKPRVSTSSKETECVWQEFIEGEEYSIDCYSSIIDGTPISIVPRKRLKVLSGESIQTITMANDMIIQSTMKLLISLGLKGVSCIQCFVLMDKIVYIDINARVGGASIVGLRAGCYFPSWMLQELNGEKVVPQIGNYKVGVMGRSFSDWTFDEA